MTLEDRKLNDITKHYTKRLPDYFQAVQFVFIKDDN